MILNLEVRNLSRVFLRGERSFKAVDNVSFSIKSGDFIGIMGDSGSGKSTLLNLIAGLLVPSSGEILIDGENVGGGSDKNLAYIRNTRIGYVPQGQSLLSNLTVFDNVRLPYYLWGRDGSPDKRAKELLDHLGIGPLAGCYPASLSGGEQRRAAIARALINSPDILIADEPTNDLDADNANEIASLFGQIADEGAAVLMVTHNLDTAAGTNGNYVMKKGQLGRR